jgi:hypothetical protein
MGVRTRGLDIKAGAAKLKTEKAARFSQSYSLERARVCGGKAIPTGQPNRRVLCSAPGGEL